MSIYRKGFLQGRMDKDSDERLIQEGFYRNAKNIIITNSEGSNAGSVQNGFSTKQLTNLNLGQNSLCIGAFNDEFQDKIYWFVVSDSGCYLLEWDNVNQAVSIVLGDTRPLNTRVLNLKKEFLITAINKIISNEISKDLFLFTDNNIEPCCINIERAKTYGVNGFEKEDIYLIKKPPLNAPKIASKFQSVSLKTNYIEQKFISFCYRFKYLDGEYSALSSYTNYQFDPKPFKLNYVTLDNEGMINSFNSIKIQFNTGDKRVTDIELVAKNSNSSKLYLIETFNKKNLSWQDETIKSYIFQNNKIYRVLPEKELLRDFDNVPLKSKSQAIIGNRVVYGNYLEGRDLVDINGKEVFVDYNIYLISNPIDKGVSFLKSFPNVNEVVFGNTIIAQNLYNTNKIGFKIALNLTDNLNSYEAYFNLILERDYTSLNDLLSSIEFRDFISLVNSDFISSYNVVVPVGYTKFTEPILSINLVGSNYVISVTPLVLQKTSDLTFLNKNFSFITVDTDLAINKTTTNSTLKTNRGYEIGLVYYDDYNRKTTVLKCIKNTIFIPQNLSSNVNKLQIAINNPAPTFAKRYKIVVKSEELRYQTLYVTNFYNDPENFTTWCQLQGNNKDKIKVGDYLIVKKSGVKINQEVIKTKVLAIEEKQRDFITGNPDASGNEIHEIPGLYFKIRPENFSMDTKDYKIYSVTGNGQSYTNFPVINLLIKNAPINVGSVFYIYIDSSFEYDSGWSSHVFEKEIIAQKDYLTFYDFLVDIFIGRNMFARVPDGGNYKDNVNLQVVGADLKFIIKGLESAGSRDRGGYINVNINLRTANDFYVFETEPILAENLTYYETEQTFDIINGFHQGSIGNQNQDAVLPAVIDLDFFNCYAQGNGIESYIIKDSFNKNFLNIDLRPSAVSLDKYKSVRRYADLTYGEPYIEDAGVNSLNEFNLSTANFKSLEKQYGGIQKLISRDNDLAVFQEEKTSLVLYGKDVLNNADGTINVTAIKDVLGQNIMYMGENGIGKNPESVAVHDKQIFYLNPTRGVAQRLSVDGVEDITDMMKDWFRDKFIENPTSIKIGGYDPYFKQYVISIKDEISKVLNSTCGQSISKFNQSLPFTYQLTLNNLSGDIVLNYNINVGNATITASFDGQVYVASNVNNAGSLSFNRTSLMLNIVTVTVIPVSPTVSYDITNICPVGSSMDLISIVINDDLDLNKSITNRFRYSGSGYFSNNDLFDNIYLSKFLKESGIEGQGKFPLRGSIVNLESFKDVINDASFNILQCNRLGYLVSSNNYTSIDLATILSLATFINVTENLISLTSKISSGNFLFNRANNNEKLYLIWDYQDKKANVVNDIFSVAKGAVKTYSILANDVLKSGITYLIVITQQPLYGVLVVNIDNTITYTHNNGVETSDIFKYKLTNGDCESNEATVNITIGSEIGTSFWFKGRYDCPDALHEPLINSWVDYIDVNNVQQRFIIGCRQNGCREIIGLSIVDYQACVPCTP